MARVTNVEPHGHKRVDCPVETVAPLESESVTEPNEEPAEIESLEWPYASEHDGEEAMASLTDAPVRLLLDSGSGMSACSPEFALHVKTLTQSSVRARSATGQVTKSLGKKTVNFDINGIAAGRSRSQSCRQARWCVQGAGSFWMSTTPSSRTRNRGTESLCGIDVR